MRFPTPGQDDVVEGRQAFCAVLFRFTGDQINEERCVIDTMQWHEAF